MNSGTTVTTVASENIRDLWKVLDNTPGKEGPPKMNINVQRKALTARSGRLGNPSQRSTNRGGNSRSKIRNWNSRDDDK